MRAMVYTLLAMSLTLATPSTMSAEASSNAVQDKTVRVIYLVSRDRDVRPEFQLAMDKANVQTPRTGRGNRSFFTACRMVLCPSEWQQPRRLGFQQYFGGSGPAAGSAL